MVADVEHWFGYASHLAVSVERLTDNGSFYIARDFGFAARITSVRTFKRDHLRGSLTPDAQTVINKQPA